MRKRITSPVAPDVLALIVGLLILVSSGCVNTHINGIEQERQGVELFILRSGETLQKIETTRNAALDTAIDLYKSGQMETDDFKTIVSISQKYDVAYKSAVKALDDFAKASRRGEGVTTAAVEAAIAAVNSVLSELQGEM